MRCSCSFCGIADHHYWTLFS